MNSKKLVIIILIFVVVILSPYILGFFFAGENFVFSGLLFNPQDGNTYLAKMVQGNTGSSRFVLPYSSETGEGTYLFLFYLSLGHISRILNIPIILMFHGCRILFSVMMCLSIYRLLRKIIGNNNAFFWNTYILILFGSGLGWLFVLVNKFTPDFWLAEAFPFLSSYANPHFPLGIAIYINIIYRFISQEKNKHLIEIFISGLLLSIIIPFALESAIAMVFLFQIIEWISYKQIKWRYLSSLFLGGIPYSIYQLIIISRHPQLSVWNAQNQTPSPSIIDFLIGIAPTVIFTIIGFFRIKTCRNKYLSYVLVWAAGSVVLMYIPFYLQRRLSIGIFIPFAIIATYGISAIWPSKYKLVSTILIMLSMPTNIVLVLTGLYAIRTHDSSVYLTRDEYKAIMWLSDYSNDCSDVVLSSPELSLFIPPYTGLKVVYGHPFETIKADEMKNFVEAYFTGKMAIEDAIDDGLIKNVDYVIQEKTGSNGDLLDLKNLKLIYKNKTVQVYSNDS